MTTDPSRGSAWQPAAPRPGSCSADGRAPVRGHRVTGVVMRGDARGRELGFPTANIALEALGSIEYGVYAGRAIDHLAAVSVGVRPTFGEGLMPLIEVHILDFEGDLYGRRIDVELVERLRPERAFDTTEALVKQIHQDVADVRRVMRAAGVQ